MSDRGNQTRSALIEGWAELEGGTIEGVTVADALKQLRDDKNAKRFGILRNALADLADRGDLPSARSIGKYLSGCAVGSSERKCLRGLKLGLGLMPGRSSIRRKHNAGFAEFAEFIPSQS